MKTILESASGRYAVILLALFLSMEVALAQETNVFEEPMEGVEPIEEVDQDFLDLTRVNVTSVSKREQRIQERQPATTGTTTVRPRDTGRSATDFSQLERDARSRNRGYDRFQNRRAVGVGGGRRGSFGGRRRR